MDNMGKQRQSLNDFLEEAELLQYSEMFRDVLKITSMTQLKFVVKEDLEQIGLSRPEQRRYKKIFSKYFPNPYLYKLRKLLSSHKKNVNCSQGFTSNSMEFPPFQDSSFKVPTKHIICTEDITINKELGKGQFGVVQQGTWTTGNQRLQVAIKCLGQERMTANSTEFLKEAAVMHSIEHPNIVRLYGVVLHSEALMLVTELAPLRSLLECLREVPIRPNFLVPNLCLFAEQICDGMIYLENKRLIHRDLAARNILVFSKHKVKISDFGLSRALGVGKDYYQTNYNVNLKLPVAWCAPECILFLRFTSASDVWAFGVCLWEMFTYGFQPWAGFSGQQILEAIDEPNFQRLERPQACPDEYYSTMLECWSHDPNNRPKFKELKVKLRANRPEQVQVITNFSKPGDGRRSNYLECKSGQIITVLGKENLTQLPLWYGVESGGTCGLFDPSRTKPYVPPDKTLTSVPSLSPHPNRHSSRSIRSSLLRCDFKRHTYTGKRNINRSMISSPQGDVKHTGHVGLDGAYFGDISFLDPAGRPPRQVVTPYRPSEDLEEVPLINPNSPSHLTGASGTSPYPMLASKKADMNNKSGDRPRNRGHKLFSESAVNRSILSKVKNATLGRPCKPETGAIPKVEEVHEYHEIPDNVTVENVASKSATKPECLQPTKSLADFSQSLIDEMESLFRNLDTKRRDESNPPARNIDGTMSKRIQSLTKADKKKCSAASTMKPMSAHDEKTLNTAVALANEITSKSMNDLGAEKSKYPHSPNDRCKFHFKFPLSLHHHSHHSYETEKEKETTGKQERRNFSEEAKSVPDIQSTITAESKMAYTSLIEDPTPSTSMMSHLAKENYTVLKPATIPKSGSNHQHVNFHSLQTSSLGINRSHVERAKEFQESAGNSLPLPLPPRNTKPKLIDKPRHIRKYPLKIPGETKPVSESVVPPPIIYQNTTHHNREDNIPKAGDVAYIDVYDGATVTKSDTNPFTNTNMDYETPSGSGLVSLRTGGANPFTTYDFENDNDIGIITINAAMEIDSDDSEDKDDNASALVRDCQEHVSVEDLLEFADQKPCGRQRGVESDEVRIMSKVFKQQVSPQECLEALELSDWNVHNAIKLLQISVSVGTEVSLEDCCSELTKANGDISKASAVLVLCKQKT